MAIRYEKKTRHTQGQESAAADSDEAQIAVSFRIIQPLNIIVQGWGGVGGSESPRVIIVCRAGGYLF